MDGFDEDEFPWDMPGPPEIDSRRARYADAYGDYRGGYGPGGGFGPPSHGPPPPMPPPMMGPPYPGGPFMGPMRGRGFGPGGPPRKNPAVNAAVNHLLSCGLTKESLKNLPNDVLMMIEPRHCGLCGINFDSFIMSRMHYISKNHAKNVKKMLSKGPTGSSKEMPFKSRDLYCELCDIQITSKAHGDAHYQGKPHRGIVEGRKKPKNPLLLQPHMQGRLEQLIRREKRALKSAPAAAEAQSIKEAPKPGPPELYCGICKTTVTCSEQMTIHMNGKRHLAKEKQHILMMMKGQPNKDENKGDANAEEGEENGNGDGEENGESQAGGEQGANDDWGDEAWEENQDQSESTAA